MTLVEQWQSCITSPEEEEQGTSQHDLVQRRIALGEKQQKLQSLGRYCFMGCSLSGCPEKAAAKGLHSPAAVV